MKDPQHTTTRGGASPSELNITKLEEKGRPCFTTILNVSY